jgi:transposase
MDMWEPYRAVIPAKLSHAAIVADRFHVMRQLNEQLTQMRRTIQAQASPEVQTVLEGSRWILVKNREGLTPRESAKLEAVLATCPELRTLYLIKEEFRLIFEKVRERSQAERFLRAWVCKAQHTHDKFLL